MGKRTAFEANTRGAHIDRDPKRQRVAASNEGEVAHAHGAAEEITTARDLQRLLLFDQGSQSDFRTGRRFYG